MNTQWLKKAGAALVLITASTAASSDVSAWLADFLASNPTNAWEVSLYGLGNISANTPSVAERWGGGARVSYWVRPAIGAALDASYCDHAWTFASLAMTARGSFNVGPVRVTPYAHAGPGWNVRSDFSKTVVAVAGAGASLELTRRKLPAVFAEMTRVITDQDQQRLVWGLTWRF